MLQRFDLSVGQLVADKVKFANWNDYEKICKNLARDLVVVDI